MGMKQTIRGVATGVMGCAALAVIGVAATTALVSPASATPLLSDQGSYTFDSKSHLDWLDVTATQGLSPDDVLNNNGVSYVQDGWHYATASDMLGLFQDAGLTLTASGGDYSLNVNAASPAGGVADLLNLLGTTYTDTSRSPYSDSFTGGWLRDPASGRIDYADLELVTSDGVTWINYAAIYTDVEQTTVGDLNDGSFLVRNHVDVTPPTVTPLPAALPMFAAATGLMGVMGWRRRKDNAA